jgi:hypothetical protein
MKLFSRLAIVCCLTVVLATGGVWAYAGVYGIHVLYRHGGTFWLPVGVDSPFLSPAMRLALAEAPAAVPGAFNWRSIAAGFEVADLPAVADGRAVDHVLLARIDPTCFRFVVRSASAGDKDLDQWMAQLGAVLVVNGSYYARHGEPDTPFLSDGTLLGPKDYDARAGAFVASPRFVGIHNLTQESWQAAFAGADDAMVSYPLLISDGETRVTSSSRWLANRSFVGQDAAGRIIIGTTTDAFFSLDRFAYFLQKASLGLVSALNLDGGPVASQGISVNGFERKTYGRWEAQVTDDQVQLLAWPYGTVAMPVVLAVFPRQEN